MHWNKKFFQKKDIIVKLSLEAGSELGADLKLHNHQAKRSLDKLVPQIAKGAGITFFGDFLGKGINFVSQIVVARMLGIELFGLYALGLVVFNVAQTLSMIGLSQAAIRFVSIFYGEGNKAGVKGTIVQSIGLPFLLGGILGLVLFISAGNIANAFNSPELANVIKIVSFGIPFMSAMMVAIAVTRGFKKMHYFVYVKNFFHPIINLACVGILYWFGFKLLGAISAWILAAVLGFMISIYFVKKEFPEFFKVKANYASKEILKFSVPLVLVGFLQMLMIRTDVLMLGCFQSSVEVGIYNAVSQIIMPLLMILMAFNSIFSPIVADFHNRKKLNELNHLFKIVSKWIFLLTLPIFIIMVISAKEVLNIFGLEFVPGSKALLILGVFLFLSTILGPVTETLIMSGRQKIEFYNTLGGFIMNLVLNFLLIPKFGIVGAAIATGISLLSLHLVRLFEIIYYLNLWPFSRKYYKGLCVGSAVALLAIIVKSGITSLTYLPSLILTTVVVFSSFIGMVWLLKFDEEDELIFMVIKQRVQSVW